MPLHHHCTDMHQVKFIKSFLVSTFCSYETPKMVQIETTCIGILYRFLLTALFATVIIWIFILNNGYQYIDRGARSSTVCKVKGVSHTNSTDPRIGKRVWDAADLYGHPIGDGAFFVTTNMIVTRRQAQGSCPETSHVGADCYVDEHCQPVGKPYHLGNGISTGVCNRTTKTCMVDAWCPIENDTLPNTKIAALKDIKDFTVFIKDHVYFPFYNKTRSNLIESISLDYLHSCHYNPKQHQYCPIFRLGDIVNMAVGEYGAEEVHDDHSYYKMAVKGGVISISIKWDCNFDLDETRCKPEYEFTRLDNYRGNSMSTGYNFRYTTLFDKDGTEIRDLTKVYGILFILETDAIARAFHLRTFLINVGSSLAILGIASVVADICLLYIHKNRMLFRELKVEPNAVIKALMREAINLGAKETLSPDRSENHVNSTHM